MKPNKNGEKSLFYLVYFFDCKKIEVTPDAEKKVPNPSPNDTQ